MGSAIIRGRTTLLLDAFELADSAWPEWNAGRKQVQQTASGGTVVLFAEDSAFFREQTIKLLEGAGYKVLAAADGAEAWEILNERWQEIHVVLTDVEMPRLDGLQFTRKIRGDRRVARMPVIMLTSLAGEDDLKRAQMAGATSYSDASWTRPTAGSRSSWSRSRLDCVGLDLAPAVWPRFKSPRRRDISA